ncbi:MAG: hypothetical protein L7U83_00965 [Akkermansiaceae bacterium]|nr:hypothetical protein [Akkermansiaceae bacterium]
MKPVWLSIFASLLFVSCSSYQRDFKESKNEFRSAIKLKPAPTGPWKGTWKSEVNGHQGPLWCMIKRDESSPGTYNFRYRAGWGLLQFGDYTHPIKTTQEDGALSLNHLMTLPNNFGTYRVKGQVSPMRFECRFQGNGDKGTMTLQRPL